MSRLEAWILHAANLLVGGSGILYAVVRYGLASQDPLSPVHPAQPLVQHAHVWTAPLLVFALGLIWKSHAWAATRGDVDRRRRSGFHLMLTAGPMALSGYFLQTAVDPGWRRAWIAVHLTASLLWLLGYLAHQLSPRPAAAPSPLNALAAERPFHGGIHAPTEADLRDARDVPQDALQRPQ